MEIQITAVKFEIINGKKTATKDIEPNLPGKREELIPTFQRLSEKIGKEKASVIADNFATIISDNMQMNKDLNSKDKEIEKLKKEKEDLMTTNMNLLQQIPMGEEPKKPTEREPEEKKPKASAFDYREVFDENGNFKR